MAAFEFLPIFMLFCGEKMLSQKTLQDQKKLNEA